MMITESNATGRIRETGEVGCSKDLRPIVDFVAYLRSFAREKPQSAALVCLAIGFVLGWKLKPW